MVGEAGTQSLAVPWPRSLGSKISGHRRVNGSQATALLDEVFECRLLLGIKDVARSAKENHHVIFRQVRPSEPIRILGRINVEMILFAEGFDSGDAVGD